MRLASARSFVQVGSDRWEVVAILYLWRIATLELQAKLDPLFRISCKVL